MPYALIVISLASVLACYLIARRRSADTSLWILLGLVFGPLAVPFAFFARPRSAARRGTESRRQR